MWLRVPTHRPWRTALGRAPPHRPRQRRSSWAWALSPGRSGSGWPRRGLSWPRSWPCCTDDACSSEAPAPLRRVSSLPRGTSDRHRSLRAMLSLRLGLMGAGERGGRAAVELSTGGSNSIPAHAPGLPHQSRLSARTSPTCQWVLPMSF